MHSNLALRHTSKPQSTLDKWSLAGATTTVILWSSAFAGIRAGLESYAPESLALLRYLTASLVLVGYALVIRMPLPDWRDLPGIAAAGFAGLTAYNIALNIGEESIPAGMASFIIASAPVFMAVIAMVFFNEHLHKWGWLGIGISFTGAAVMSLAKGGGVRVDYHALLVLLAAVLQAIYSTSQKSFLQKYGALRFTTYAIIAGTIFLLVFMPTLLHDIQHATTEATLAIIYMGIFPGAIAYVCWSFVLSQMPASIAGSFLYIIPFSAVLIAWIWLGEVPPTIAFLGGGLILTGVFVVNTYGKNKPSTSDKNHSD